MQYYKMEREVKSGKEGDRWNERNESGSEREREADIYGRRSKKFSSYARDVNRFTMMFGLTISLLLLLSLSLSQFLYFSFSISLLLVPFLFLYSSPFLLPSRHHRWNQKYRWYRESERETENAGEEEKKKSREDEMRV